jgi:hypothetical protein
MVDGPNEADYEVAVIGRRAGEAGQYIPLTREHDTFRCD